VNISAFQFRDEGFREGTFAILKDTGLQPRFLELELTESVLMKTCRVHRIHPQDPASRRGAGGGR
jgi:EAL domain-containing protein (putative c-di-GMP-specific phosphodiesterase class I)